jgi:hypothetical protein
MRIYFGFALVLIMSVCMSAEAQLKFLADSSQQDKAALTFERLTLIHSDDTETQNGTALRNELIAQASNQTVDVILLEPGTYDIGSTALNMVNGANIQGFAANNTLITGSGSVVINGASSLEIHDISIHGSGNGSTIVLQDSGEMDLIEVNIQHNGTGTDANFGIRVINGGSIYIQDSEIVFEQNGNSGSFTGLYIAGDDGAGQFSGGTMTNANLEILDDSNTMTLIGLQLGDGTTTPSGGEMVSIEIFGGIIVTEGGDSGTAIFVDSDADLFIEGGCVESDDTALDNDGLGSAISTLFDGTRGGTGTTVYSQCSAYTVGGPAPINNSLTAVN